MNVANLTPPVGPVAPAAGALNAVGTAGEQAYGSLGNLFAMQMTAVLDNMQAADEVNGLASGGELIGEDMAEMSEWLLLLQQFLSLTPQEQQEAAAQLTEKADRLPELLSKLPQPQPVTGDQADNLLAAFTQRGIPQATGEKLAAFLTALSQANQQQMGQNLLAKPGMQAEEILQQLGIQLPRVEKGQAEQKKPFATLLQASQENADANKQSALLQQTQRTNLQQTLQPMRFTQALASYQAEAGLQSKLTMPAAAAPSVDLSGSEPDANILPGQIGQPAWFEGAATRTTGPLAAHPVQAHQFSQQVTQLFVKQMKLTEVNGVHEARLILYPQSLGQVDVKITSHNGMITAQFHAETAAGKELLDNQLSQLRTALTQQGLQVDRLEVNQQPQQSALSFQQQQRERQQQQQENENRQKQTQDETEFSLEDLLSKSEEAISRIGRSR